MRRRGDDFGGGRGSFVVLCASAVGAVAVVASAMARGAVNAPGSGKDEPALRVEVKCDPVPGPGKVQCVVHVRPIGGRFRWGDVIVLAAPPFAAPLRTRVAAGDASRSDAEGADFALAL